MDDAGVFVEVHQIFIKMHVILFFSGGSAKDGDVALRAIDRSVDVPDCFMLCQQTSAAASADRGVVGCFNIDSGIPIGRRRVISGM